jgi:pSer/pThr/pTyr-binding forkhead associated (FHA) protein
MAKLVIQNQGMTGRACELHTDRTTIGRVEDNTFQIADPSVSSHHCEVQLRGSDIVIRDLNSTNGSFISGNKIEESVLKPGQILRLGQVELKLEVEGASATPAAPGAMPLPGPAKKQVDATMLIPRGVSLDQLEKGGTRPTGFDTNASFSKKTNKVNKYFIIIGIVVAVVIVGLLIYLLTLVNSGKK